MKIAICLDYSVQTERVLRAARLLIGTRLPEPEIKVIHIMDHAPSELEKPVNIPLPKELEEDALKIHRMAKEYLPPGFLYITEYGAPQQKIDEILTGTSCDLLIMGTKGKSAITNVIGGSLVLHFLHHAKIPLMLVP